MLQEELEEQALLEEWLSTKRGQKVMIRIPKKGTKEKLVELAEENAQLVLNKDKERLKREEGRTIGAVKEIAALLGMERIVRMEAYAWWIHRIEESFKIYDVLRIDHFKGFSDYWQVDGKADIAKYGSWQPGPGYDLFKAVKEQLGDLPIIAEDLGNIDDKARKLLADLWRTANAINEDSA